MSVFDSACDYARDMGIPENEVQNVVDGAPLCERCGTDGDCWDETKAYIDGHIPPRPEIDNGVQFSDGTTGRVDESRIIGLTCEEVVANQEPDESVEMEVNRMIGRCAVGLFCIVVFAGLLGGAIFGGYERHVEKQGNDGRGSSYGVSGI